MRLMRLMTDVWGRRGGELHTYLHTAIIDICKTNEKFLFDTFKYLTYCCRTLAQTKLHNLADYQEVFHLDKQD